MFNNTKAQQGIKDKIKSYHRSGKWRTWEFLTLWKLNRNFSFVFSIPILIALWSQFSNGWFAWVFIAIYCLVIDGKNKETNGTLTDLDYWTAGDIEKKERPHRFLGVIKTVFTANFILFFVFAVADYGLRSYPEYNYIAYYMSALLVITTNLMFFELLSSSGFHMSFERGHRLMTDEKPTNITGITFAGSWVATYIIFFFAAIIFAHAQKVAFSERIGKASSLIVFINFMYLAFSLGAYTLHVNYLREKFVRYLSS